MTSRAMSRWMLPASVCVLLILAGGVHSQESDEKIATEKPVTPESPVEPSLYQLPVVDKKEAYLFEPFASAALSDGPVKWVLSQSKKDQADTTVNEKYDGEWAVEGTNVSRFDGDYALVLKSAAKHHGIAAKLPRPYSFTGKPFIFQYDVKFANGQECGGAYVKLLQKGSLNNLADLNDKTPYTIMFGPDKCGKEAHLRFIFQHKNPITGVFQEKHWKEPSSLKIEDLVTSKRSHLYTLVINPDSTFSVYVDQKEVGSGSLLHDVSPAVNPPAEIEDSDDKKPEEWDERKTVADPSAKKPETWEENAPEKMQDPSAVRPDGWLEEEPEMIHDLEAARPEDWDNDMDGDWEAPLVENPKCKSVGCGSWNAPLIANPKCKAGGCGHWSAPMIENPNYKGKWAARKIANPGFFEDAEPYKMTSIDALAMELWSISNEVSFDNFLVTDDKAVADRVASQTWQIKSKQEAASGSDSALSYTMIGVIVATVVGLIGVVLVRTYFRKQTLPAENDDSVTPKNRSEPVSKSTEPNAGKRQAKVVEIDPNMPPLEGDEKVEDVEEGSGDNAESGSASADSGSEVETEEAPLVHTKDVLEEARTAAKPKSRARRE